MENFINGNRNKSIDDTGCSPVTTFALNEVKTIREKDKLRVREKIEKERYLGSNGKPLQLLG